MTTTNEPFVAHVGEPRRPLAGFIDADFPGLPPEQAQALRALELADKAEERARQVEFAERREMAENRALAESASRSHARGRQWDPSNPWRDYPSHDVRVQEAFALQDVMAASELRQARREAAKVLREHGVHAQIVIDSNAAESPHPVEPAGVPASRSQGMAPSGMATSGPVAARANPTGSRIRAAFDRWAHPKRGHQSGPTGCGCAACRANATVRSYGDGSRPLNSEVVRYR